MRRIAGPLALGVVLTQGVAARAEPTKVECVAAADLAQKLEHDRRLIDSRAQLRICEATTCPAVVRSDCAQWLERANREQPSVVFAAKDAAGSDVTAVTVTLDGKHFADKLDGEALEVDPGEHAFVLQTPGLPSVTKHLVILAGEKDRREVVVFETPAAPPAPTATHPLRVAGIAVLGVGAVGLGVGIVTGAVALSDGSTVDSNCPNNTCKIDQSSNISSGRTLAAVSTASFIVSAALVPAGIVGIVYTSSSSKSDSAWRLSVGPGAIGGEF